MKEMSISWEQKLEEAKKKWEIELHVQESKGGKFDYSHPYLQVSFTTCNGLVIYVGR